MILEIYNFIFGNNQSKEYRQRIGFLVKVSKYELIEASLPVFVAAGVTGSASAIIDTISSDSDDLEISLTFLYALTMYFVGKWFSYLLMKDEDANSSTFPFPLLRSYKISKLLRHSFSELSGFSWKEFFILFCLKAVYLDEGYGPSFGTWMLLGFIALLTILLSSHIQRKLFKLSSVWNQKMLIFDIETFALAIAYVFTVLFCLAFWKIGFAWVEADNLIFDWDENFKDTHSSISEGSGTTLLYSFLVACFVAVAQLPENEDETVVDELCDAEVEASLRASSLERTPKPPSALQDAINSVPNTMNPLSPSNHSSFELDNSAGSATMLPNATPTSLWKRVFDTDTIITYMTLWNEVLGYFAGVSYFVLILEFSNLVLGYKIIPATIIAALVTYRGPHILAKLRIITELEAAKKNAALNQGEDSSTAINTSTTSTSSEAVGEARVVSEPGFCNPVIRAIRNIQQSYKEVNLKRKGVMMVSIRLTVGWLWEVVVQDGFDLIKNTEDNLEEYLVVLLEIVYALIVVIIVLCVHLYVRDWATDALAKEDERTLNAYSAHAGVGQTGTEGGAKKAGETNGTGTGASANTGDVVEGTSGSLPRPSDTSVNSVSYNGSTITV